MALSDFTSIVRNIEFSNAGLSTLNGRWTDTGPHGHHIPLTSGTPTISTVGGMSRWAPANDGTVYSEYDAPKGGYSVIMPVYGDSTSAANFWWGAYRLFAAGDHDGTTNTFATWADGDSIIARTAGTAASVLSASGTIIANGTIVRPQWNVITFATDPMNAKIKIKVNDAATVITTAANWNSFFGIGCDRIRVGHLTHTPGTPLVGTFGLGSLTEISGDIFVEQAGRLATEVAALKTAYAIP